MASCSQEAGGSGARPKKLPEPVVMEAVAMETDDAESDQTPTDPADPVVKKTSEPDIIQR